MMRVLQGLAGACVIAAIFFSFLFTLSFWNRLTILRDRDRYKPAVYVVTDAEIAHGDDGISCWLNGTVDNVPERFVPDWGGDRPVTAAEARRRFPSGTKIEVLYNPTATSMIMQGETLRVLQGRPDFWAHEARLRRRLAWFVFAPVTVTLPIYLALRIWNRRRDSMAPQSDAPL